MVVSINKFSPYLVLFSGISLWVASTVTACIYSHKEYQETLKNDARDITYRIQDYFNVYEDLVVSFYALHESKDKISQQEADRFFESWKVYHFSKFKKEEVKYYGWYSLLNTKENSFYSIVDPQEKIKITFNGNIKEDTRSLKEDEFDVIANTPYLNIEKIDYASNLILSKKFEKKNTHSAAAISFSALIKQNLKTKYANYIWATAGNSHFPLYGIFQIIKLPRMAGFIVTTRCSETRNSNFS